MTNQFIKYRYIIPKDKKDVVDFAETLNKVFETTQAIDTLDDVLEVIEKLNALGVFRMAEHASAIVKDKQLLIKNKALYEKFYSVKINLINSLKGSKYSASKMSKLLYFYRF